MVNKSIIRPTLNFQKNCLFSTYKLIIKSESQLVLHAPTDCIRVDFNESLARHVSASYVFGRTLPASTQGWCWACIVATTKFPSEI